MRYSRKARPDLALLVALAVFACAPGTPPAPAPEPTPPPEVRRLELGGDDIAAMAELLRAEDRRTLDSARIARLLEHPLPEVRQRAAGAAGRIGDARASGLLVQALDDSSRAVGAEAAFALGLVRDASAAIVYALATKLGVAWGEDDERAVEAVAALGRIGTPAAHAAVRQVLQRYVGVPAGTANANAAPPAVGEVGKEALLAIWKFPVSEAAVDLILPHLASDDEQVRWRATYAFTRMSAPRAVPAVRAKLADSSPLVRSLAARALRAGVADSAQQRHETMLALTGALSDAHPHVQINAAGALATYRDSSAAPALARLLSLEDANVRLAAAQALAAAGGAMAADTLARLAADSEEPLVVRNAAITGLLRIAPDRGVAHAVALAASPNWLARLYAARALADATWAAAGPALQPLVSDLDGRVATAAVRAINAMTDSVTAPNTLYLQALASPHPGVRAAAAVGLGRRANAADLAALMQAYERAQSDSVNDAALGAIDALAALQRSGVPVNRAFFLRFRPSSDAEVRRRVARHFGAEFWGDGNEEDPSARRGLSFYENVVRDLVVPALVDGRRPRAVFTGDGGTIVVELASAEAPLTVHNFITLATNGFYPRPGAALPARFRWHRVVPNFVLQDGDPQGDGTGGPGYAVRDEINRLRYRRAMLGMARSGPDTGGSQFFITHSPQPHLDGGYTVFGRVITGMEVADRVVQDDPILSIEITR